MDMEPYKQKPGEWECVGHKWKTESILAQFHVWGSSVPAHTTFSQDILSTYYGPLRALYIQSLSPQSKRERSRLPFHFTDEETKAQRRPAA